MTLMLFTLELLYITSCVTFSYSSTTSSSDLSYDKQHIADKMPGSRLFIDDENAKENCRNLEQFGLPSLVASSLLSKSRLACPLLLYSVES